MTRKRHAYWLIGTAMLVAAGCGGSGEEDPVLRPEPGGTEEDAQVGAAAAEEPAAAPETVAEQAAGECEASGDLEYVCGPVNAEDIVQLGDTRWLIVSGMSVDGGQGQAPAPGRLYLVDHQRRTFEEWFPAEQPAMRFDGETFGGCPGPLNTQNFSAHGLALDQAGDGRFRLYMTSHGEREAIEVFDIDASSARPSIAWVGCVVLPERTFSNSVAILSDGGFVTTKMMDPTAENGFAAIRAGEITGNVYEWHPGGEVEAVEGTELSGANGIEVSPDDRYMYVAAFGSREVVRFDREADPVEARTVAIDILADNLRWSDDGKLYTVGGNYVSPDECAEPPCQTGWSVVAIDPETLEWTRVAGADQNAALQGASTALPVGDEIWIGTFSGDRIGYLPRP